jgi:hypothetical protein
MSVSGKNPLGIICCNLLLIVIGLYILVGNPFGVTDVFPKTIATFLIVFPLYCSYSSIKYSRQLRVDFDSLKLPAMTPMHQIQPNAIETSESEETPV